MIDRLRIILTLNIIMADIEVLNHPIEQANGLYIDQGQEGDNRTWTKAIPEWENVTEFVIDYNPNFEQWQLSGSEEDDSESYGKIGETDLGVTSSTLPWELDWYYDGDTFAVVQYTSEVETDAVSLRDQKYATPTELGSKRFRRLVALGYV